MIRAVTERRNVMSELRDRMEADLRLRNLRPKTRYTYLGYVRAFAFYHMRSPADMGTKEVRDFLVHLRDECKLQPMTIKGYVHRHAGPARGGQTLAVASCAEEATRRPERHRGGGGL
jgi:hypothetical protein